MSRECSVVMSSATTLAPPAAVRLARTDLALYAAVVFLWGTSWIALRAQLGVVAPEVSAVWRFALAAAVMWGWVGIARVRVSYGWADHVRFFATGCCLFSLNFTLFYYGALTIPSGLLAVIFSLASIINVILSALLLRQRIERRVAAGGVLGAAGIALLFWPQIAGAGFDRAALAGLGLCIGGTVLFCFGNMMSMVVQRRGVPLLASIAWAMTYGLGVLVAVSLARRQAFTIEPTAVYVASVLYLAVGASVMAFAAYLALLRRVGAARAGYSTVLFPIVALAISTVVEGYVWTVFAVIGVILALAGNVLVLRQPVGAAAP
jgi:drug/metabolite transporter (DMT)-like permease